MATQMATFTEWPILIKQNLLSGNLGEDQTAWLHDESTTVLKGACLSKAWFLSGWTCVVGKHISLEILLTCWHADMTTDRCLQ